MNVDRTLAEKRQCVRGETERPLFLIKRRLDVLSSILQEDSEPEEDTSKDDSQTVARTEVEHSRRSAGLITSASARRTSATETSDRDL